MESLWLFQHTSIHRWVIRLVPIISKKMVRCKKPVSQFWHIDETYIKIKGQLYYLYRANNRIEQDHHFIKKRVRAMLSLKIFYTAKIMLAGIELMHMIHKGQFNFPIEKSTSVGSFYPLIS